MSKEIHIELHNMLKKTHFKNWYDDNFCNGICLSKPQCDIQNEFAHIVISIAYCIDNKRHLKIPKMSIEIQISFLFLSDNQINLKSVLRIYMVTTNLKHMRKFLRIENVKAQYIISNVMTYPWLLVHLLRIETVYYHETH